MIVLWFGMWKSPRQGEMGVGNIFVFFSIGLSFLFSLPSLASCEDGLKAELQGKSVVITSVDGKLHKNYMRTDRTREMIRTSLHWSSENVKRYIDSAFLRGKKVLDAGAGDGAFVEELRRDGVDADGLDIVLNPVQRTKSYFREADIRSTGYPDNSFDFIISVNSVFHYDESPRFYRQTIKEILRIAKPGAHILLVDSNSGLNELLDEPKLRVIEPHPDRWLAFNNNILLEKLP